MADDLTRRVDAKRLEQLTLDLVRIKSYTGDTREVAGAYARCLEEIGLEVQLLDDFPQSPCVVARLRGQGDGPTLQFNGHLDTVPLPHAEPRTESGRVYGRGSADMKGGLAAIAEAARVLRESGAPRRGHVLIVTHGLHEAPDGYGEDLRALVQRGIRGDAAIIAEIGADTLPIIGLGSAAFDIRIGRPGEPTHELLTPAGTPHPLLAGVRLVNLLQARHAALAEHPLPRVGAESYFLGILQGGDFFNRVPTSCRLVGLRRYGPDSAFASVRAEMEEMTRQVRAETGAEVDLGLTRVRDGFRVDEREKIVVALRAAYAEVAGKDLPLVGSRMVGDASIFTQEAGIPAVYHGPKGDGAHADVESVPIAELVRAARVYVVTALRYLGTA